MHREIAVIDLESNEPLTDGYELRLTGWTERRFWRDAPDNKTWEFVDGEVIVASPVDMRHQQVVGYLSTLATSFCAERQCGTVLAGPAALSLREGLVREPDIFVLPPAEAARAHGSKLKVCPCLIIEVTDTDSERRDLVEKPVEYAARGVPEYWSVHLRKHQVAVFRKGRRTPSIVRSGRLESSGFPGFWIDVAWLWQEPLPNPIHCLKRILGVSSL